MRRELAIIPTIAVGLAAAAVAVSSYQGNPQFAADYQANARLDPHQLASMLMTTDEAVPHGVGPAAIRAACNHGRQGQKLNPWKCSVQYANGDIVRYLIAVAANGKYEGADLAGHRVVRGCCVVGVAHPSQ
jgi:hypothetical protein